MKYYHVKLPLFNCCAAGCALLALLLLAATIAEAAIIVNDSWADGGRNNGPDPLDSNWWVSSNPNGIEASVGSLGMVTGSQGRGIHTVFPTQTLANVGDKLVATYTFRTPQTVGTPGSAAFRVGLFDTLERAALNADITASSTTPNAAYGWGTGASPSGPGTAGLPGYMMDMDVGAGGTEDLNFRAHDAGTVNPTGRLMGTTTGFTSITPSGPDGAFTFTPNTTYTGSLTLTRVSAIDMQISGTLGSATHMVTDAFDSANVGLLAFWANSNTFGTSSTPGEANNGIDFTNVTIEFIPVPEPASLVFAIVGSALATWPRAARRRR
jgi:hypothetical protein